MDLWRSRSSGVCSRIKNDRLPLLKNIFSRSTRMGNRMRTIAIIDDNPSMLKGLDRLLSAHGFHVRTFTSAELFLENLPACEVDCLLLDIHLGGISGIDLQRRLTSSGTDLPVIFMTAIDNEATRQEAFDAGCVAYLRKPFLANLLIDAINKVP
ncbi:Response regulator receiver domain-containing protein [Bradyrhizobium lablabi]|uniref:Response regulator receiver domain-containing protein n=3 Tax=Nitrobacteraceae TaxID=41294 RepID=A0ABY0PHN2_9BRAD|nr:Response regulator receiver domain-containing protein [Bradyrhizobium ottawaense]SED87614.1 Response regulator receiver domain-containing protein [Bradyrhizobium lablabi]SHL83900.1 Response regulator receiver domain-containing protein [Bradyrhizobium lablabi]